MKTVFLVRHAKAEHGDLPDRDRPLADRGLQDASTMGARLAARHLKPDLMLSSPALRALTTAQLFADEIGHDRKLILVDERLYASSADVLLAIVQGLDARLQRVMLFGHNPEFAELAHRWSNTIFAMPTCAVAEFGFDTKSWADLGTVAPINATLDSPKT